MLPESVERYRQIAIQSRYTEVIDYENRRVFYDNKSPWPYYCSPLSEYNFLSNSFEDPSFEKIIYHKTQELNRKLKVLMPYSACLEFHTAYASCIEEAIGITAIDYGDEYYKTLVSNSRLPDFRKVIGGDIHSKQLWEQVPFDIDLVIQAPHGAFSDSIFCDTNIDFGDLMDKDHMLSMYTFLELFKNIYNHMSNDNGLFYTQFPEIDTSNSVKISLLKNLINLLRSNSIAADSIYEYFSPIKVQKTPNSPKTLDNIDFSKVIPAELLNHLKCPDCPIMEGCRFKNARSVQEVVEISKAKNTGATRANVTSRLAGIVGDSVRNRTTVKFNSDGSIASAVCHRENDPTNIRGQL